MTALLPGQHFADRYVIETQIGEGGMGIVYRARRLSDRLPVAIKLLQGEALTRPDLRKRFEREAIALSALTHPNVIGVLEFGELGPALFLVMELLDGMSVESVLESRALAPEMALGIADQLHAGLGYVHAHGILHRDVKPENMYLAKQPDGTHVVKLLDFGLVKFTDKGAFGEGTQLTADGAMMGSPPYMAPEQIFGDTVDARTDVYAAGVVLYELLTGSWPFVGEEIGDLFRAHAQAPVPALSVMRPELEARAELDAVIQRAMAKRREDRFADAREMRAALTRVPKPAARIRA
jgi:eukaryotic-like serine/threonine-protein kinase